VVGIGRDTLAEVSYLSGGSDLSTLPGQMSL
jgi:hypothetical protein